MTKNEKMLALLAEAGAELTATLSARNLTRELFDRFPGDERTHELSGRLFWTKAGRLGGIGWAAYTNEPPEEPG